MSDEHHVEIGSLLARADASLRAAELLCTEKLYDDCASRAYYAAFYGASALILSRALKYRKHGQVLGAVHRDFVKPGLLASAHGKNLNWLFELRAVGDYGEIRHVESQDAREAIHVALSFLKEVRRLCIGKLSDPPC